ncbi:hypothetical protein HK097_009563 [Rhizophlyctis rosea]|uniref:CinA C-terminal domain-containing protein n=1 Tax=Rhizophlyctis rosea TaxID=64517 RepID=A0AAD5SB32_9FUNG|nr:hypothetical protein HK097_009563 [Rhizophlyctis rosea]
MPILPTLSKLPTIPTHTLSIAESLTGGLLSSSFVSQSGASKYFLGSITAYTLDSKVKLLNIDATHAREVDCVSPLVARQMAKGVTEAFGSRVGIATTGYAERPEGGGNVRAHFAVYDSTSGEYKDGRWEGKGKWERNEVRGEVARRARKLYEDWVKTWK